MRLLYTCDGEGPHENPREVSFDASLKTDRCGRRKGAQSISLSMGLFRWLLACWLFSMLAYWTQLEAASRIFASNVSAIRHFGVGPFIRALFLHPFGLFLVEPFGLCWGPFIWVRGPDP